MNCIPLKTDSPQKTFLILCPNPLAHLILLSSAHHLNIEAPHVTINYFLFFSLAFLPTSSKLHSGIQLPPVHSIPGYQPLLHSMTIFSRCLCVFPADGPKISQQNTSKTKFISPLTSSLTFFSFLVNGADIYLAM